MKQGHSYCDGASLPASARIAEATHAVEKQAILPARSARNTSRVTAVRMRGTMPERHPTIMPMEPRFPKPQSAYVAMVWARSESPGRGTGVGARRRRRQGGAPTGGEGEDGQKGALTRQAG